MQPAEVAAARRKVKQALDACRTASQRLAQAQTIDVYGQRSCHGEHDITAAAELIRLALTEHDHVDVVVLASPR
jgi:hypothetical protein